MYMYTKFNKKATVLFSTSKSKMLKGKINKKSLSHKRERLLNFKKVLKIMQQEQQQVQS
jgi:hypothetical protein